MRARIAAVCMMVMVKHTTLTSSSRNNDHRRDPGSLGSAGCATERKQAGATDLAQSPEGTAQRAQQQRRQVAWQYQRHNCTNPHFKLFLRETGHKHGRIQPNHSRNVVGLGENSSRNRAEMESDRDGNMSMFHTLPDLSSLIEQKTGKQENR